MNGPMFHVEIIGVVFSSTPWGALASLALFKLFTDWQASGYPIPVDMCPNKVTKRAGRMEE